MANNTSIIGTYECKMDAKGRVLLPSGLKKQLLEGLNDGFVIKRSVFGDCLELYPKKEWEKEAAVVNQLNRFVKKNVLFIRKFMAGMKEINLDSQDRFLIPRDLLPHANLQKDLVLSSAVNKIEIWDKERYEAELNSIDDFATLAEEVMGNIQPE